MSEKTPGSSGRKNMILNIVLVLCIVVIAVCGVKIVHSLIEYQNAEDKYSGIRSSMEEIMKSTSKTTATEPNNSSSVSGEVTEPTDTTVESTTAEPKPVPREEYRAIYEQLSTWKEQYPDLFGWIYIEFDEDHTINLPVMQGEDNNYYISHAYDGTESTSGAIFVDYRNTDRRIDLNQNMIFYGHNMNNSTMFAQVATKYKVRANFDNVPITFYSLEGMYTFNVFSIYNAKAGDDYDTVAFGGEKLQQFCYDKQSESFYSKKLTFNNDETVLTLVTCTSFGSEGRVIVHGVLDGYDSFFN